MPKTLGSLSVPRRTLFLLVLFSSACQYDPFAHEYTTSRPAESDLPGTYRPDRETTQRIKQEFGVVIDPSCELTLRSDRTFNIREMPRCWFVASNEDCAAGTEDVAGTWELTPQQQRWAVRLTKRSMVAGVDHSYSFPAMLRGSEPPYLLHFIIGDPDSGNGLAFAREERGLTSR
jgi:hypothetical protein